MVIKKYLRILLGFPCILGVSMTVMANPQQMTDSPVSNAFSLKKISPQLLYGYIDFNFDSTIGNNFNRYQGTSNLYMLGGDQIKIGQSITTGLYVSKVDSKVNSQFSITPGVVNYSHQDIHNYTLFGHLMKKLKPQFDIDVFGGYGWNAISANNTTNINLPASFSNRNNNNWFVGSNALYYTAWKKVLVRANLGVLYSQIDSGNYIQRSLVNQIIPALTNKATYVAENIEFGYKFSERLIPFVAGGLVQVVDFSNSPNTVITPINGSLPQLNVDQNGFRLAGGIRYSKDNFGFRVEERYYNAGNTFRSYQTNVGLDYRFS